MYAIKNITFIDWRRWKPNNVSLTYIIRCLFLLKHILIIRFFKIIFRITIRFLKITFRLVIRFFKIIFRITIRFLKITFRIIIRFFKRIPRFIIRFIKKIFRSNIRLTISLTIRLSVRFIRWTRVKIILNIILHLHSSKSIYTFPRVFEGK